MSDTSPNNYFYLNRDSRWPGFQMSGLEIRDGGALELASLPVFPGALSAAVSSAPVPDGPAGLAMDSTGTLYFSDPDGNCIRRILGCDGTVCAVPCMGSATLDTPRGLLISPERCALFVADSGHNRILVFDLASFAVQEVWGQIDPNGTTPGSDPGSLDTPWTLAEDSAGNVYVVDYGNRRVQKFNAIGEVQPSFAANVEASGLLHQPADIAVREQDGAVWILVADSADPGVYFFDSLGHPILDAKGNTRILKDAHLTEPAGIAVAGESLFIGDNGSGRVLRFRIGDGFPFIGTAIGYLGPVAGLLLDRAGGLWVHPGDSLTPNRLKARGGYVTIGTLWTTQNDPITVPGIKPVEWHRLKALIENLPANAHLDLYAFVSNDKSSPPKVDPNAADPFADSKWQSIDYTANLDITELFIGAPPGSDPRTKFLWVGALFSGDGTASPRLENLRVEFDYPSYSELLPAVYRDTENCGQFLERLLALFESFFSHVEGEIESLPALFDPKAAPKDFLPWLAGGLGLDLDENWTEETQRRIIARIFELSGKRGTVAGLRESLRLFAGVDAIIDEPLLNAAWWALPASDSCCADCAAHSGGAPWEQTQNSILGWTTMLAPAEPQGAVVGATAVLDQSHLITEQDFGSPLFSDLAYQFSVQIYRGQLMCPGTLDNVRAVLEREKPAHTTYHLCIIEPRFRVGFQSRVGIDTVVGGPQRSLSLDTSQRLGLETVLAGPPPSLLGPDNRLGVNTRLG